MRGATTLTAGLGATVRATLFSAAAEIGPVIAGSGKEERAAARSYGANLGLAFQLVDDALDYGGNAGELGKAIGNDFAEGKITLPVLLAYRRGGNTHRAFWRRVMEEQKIEAGDLERAVELMRESGALDDTIRRARHFGAVALDGLAPFAEGDLKSALLEVVEFTIARTH